MKKILFLILIVISTSASAQTFNFGGINYEVTNATTPLTVKVGSNNSIFSGPANIPTTVTFNSNTYSVTSIGIQAFLFCSGLTSVTIPNSITSIDKSAFYSCTGLTSVTIPNSVASIGVSAFARCSSLTSITIPNSVTSIGNQAFALCNSLTSVTISNSVTSVDQYAFYGCTGLTSVTVNWPTPLAINSNVFGNVNLSNVILNTPVGTNAAYDAAPVWTDFIIAPPPNLAPTDISLSASAVNENIAANATIASLSTTDPDGGTTFSYSLVSGAGSTDNTSFNISGNNLSINNSPDFETKSSYSIRIRTNDQGATYEKNFTITINDLEELPKGCWRTVSTGGYHTLAIAQDGTLWAWGDNDFMQLGNGVAGDKTNPTQVSNVGNWASVAAGEYYSLAIKTDGTLWAWGRNDFGQLGNNTTTQQNIPVQIGTATNWKTISAGYSHSIATKTDGTLWAWGRNNFGQVGNGTIVQQNAPVQIGTDTNWSSVKLGRNHTLALKTSGQLWAWGRATFGQLGTGNTTQQNAPIQIGTAADWSEIQAGENNGLALKTNGTLWSWGDNFTGQLGTGNTTQQNAPVQIGTDANWSKIAAGSFNGYALKTTGTLWSWGDNYFGQVGNGNFTQQNSPVQVGAATDWHSITAGNYYGIAQKTTGTFLSWGDNQAGQLGNGSTTPNTTGVNAPGSMGCSGNVLSFDGVNDRVRIVNSGTGILGDNSLNENYTIEMKVKLNTVANNKLFSKSSSASNQGFTIETDPIGFLFFDQAYGNVFSRVQTSYPLLPNKQYRIVATFNYANKTHKLYVDGVEVDAITEIGTPNFINSDAGIGYSYADNSGKFDGKFNDLRIWNVERTPTEVSAYTRNSSSYFSSQSIGLVAHFKMNQGNTDANNAGLTTLYNEVVGNPSGILENFALTGSTSNWTNENDVTETLSTNNFSIVGNIKIYPNPSTGISNISMNEEATIEVRDLLGKVIYNDRIKAGSNTIDISNYPSGIYLLQVKTENGSVTKKLIKE